MNLETRKIDFIKTFLQLEDEKSLERHESLLFEMTSKTENEFNKMTIAELKERISKSMMDSENGRTFDSNSLKELIREWS